MNRKIMNKREGVVDVIYKFISFISRGVCIYFFLLFVIIKKIQSFVYYCLQFEVG